MWTMENVTPSRAPQSTVNWPPDSASDVEADPTCPHAASLAEGCATSKDRSREPVGRAKARADSRLA